MHLRFVGQSIPHVHFHILPRKASGDRFSNNDDVYPALEAAESILPSDYQTHASTPATPTPLKVDADEDRLPRTMEEMEKEAQWLKGFFDAEQ